MMETGDEGAAQQVMWERTGGMMETGDEGGLRCSIEGERGEMRDYIAGVT